MIIGDSFVIGHLGKTGGDALLIYAQILRRELPLVLDDCNDGRKHQTFAERIADGAGGLLQGKDRILGIRNLETWLVSYHRQFLLQYRTPIHDEALKQGKIPFYVLNKEYTRWTYEPADRLLATYLDQPIRHWIRCESLLEDFLSVIRCYHTVSSEAEAEMRGVAFSKPRCYTDEFESYFAPEDSERIRANNPVWGRIEANVYTTG